MNIKSSVFLCALNKRAFLSALLAACAVLPAQAQISAPPLAPSVHEGLADIGTLGGLNAFPQFHTGGRLIGTSNTVSGAMQAYLWQSPVTKGYGTQGTLSQIAPAGTTVSTVTYINAGGQQLGSYQTGATFTDTDGSVQPVRFAFVADLDGTFHTLSLGGHSSTTSLLTDGGQALGVADTGATYTDADGLTQWVRHAFLYDAKGMHELSLGGNNSWGANIIAGRVVGTGETGATYTDANGLILPISHAFVYDATGMHDLGTLPGGTNSAGSSINKYGQVMGVSDTGQSDALGNPIQHPFFWDGTQMHDLSLGGVHATGFQLTDAGQVAGVSDTPATYMDMDGNTHTVQHAFLYDVNGTHDLSLGGNNSRFVGMGPGGSVVGYSETGDTFADPDGDPSPITHAFLNDAAGLHDLSAAGSPNSYPDFVGSAGQVAGVFETGSTYTDVSGAVLPVQHTFLYDTGGMHDLGTLGGPVSFPIQIGTGGQITGYSQTGDIYTASNGTLTAGQHVFLYDAAGLHDLSLGGHNSQLRTLTDTGQVTGVSDTGAAYTDPQGGGHAVQHAFLYDVNGMHELSLGGGNSSPSDINRSGQLVGVSDTTATYTDATGKVQVARHAFFYDGISLHDLGTLGGPNSNPTDLSDKGQIVGVSDLNSTYTDVNGFAQPVRHTFLAILPPTLVANDAPAAVGPEGATVVQTGTWTDVAGVPCTITASVGTVTKSSSGTWRWSITAPDGPSGPLPVTVTLDDGQGGPKTVAFTYSSTNVSPTATISVSPSTPLAGSSATLSAKITDPAAADVAAGFASSWTVTDAGGTTVASGTDPTLTWTPASAGTYTVSVTVTDKDGGASTAVKTLSVQNAVPVLTAISPGSASAGGAAFTLTATGTSFVTGSLVNWNGTALSTTYVSPTQLTAAVPASLLWNSGGYPVTVSSPYAALSGVKTFTVKPPALATITVSPTSVYGGGTVTGTVTIAAPAPTGGSVVVLSSDTPGVGSVAASVTVPAGATSVTFPVTTTPVAASTQVTLSGTLNGGPKTAKFTVNPPVLTGFTLSSGSVTVGTSVTATVTLGSPAPAAGYAVMLSSNNAAASVPASVTVPAGATTATFPVTTNSGPATVTLTAVGGATKTATLTVQAPSLYSVTLNPASAYGGTAATGTVILATAAGVDTPVTLSVDQACASVPATVTVPAGTTSATFTLSTVPVATSTQVTVTGVAGGATKTATFTVNPPALTGFTLSSGSVNAGTGVTATLTLGSPAPAAGYAVSISSNSAAASVPASVTIPAGATTTMFPVTTNSGPATVTLTAVAGSTTKTATLTVKTLSLSSITLNPTSAYGGISAMGTVTLSAVAGVDTPVTLSVDQTCASVPVTVTVPAGASSATFTLSTVPVVSNVQVTVTGVAGGATKTAKFTVKSPALTGFTLSSGSVTVGTGVTATVTLGSPAPAAGYAVTLSSNNAAASVPASVTIPAGATTATVTVTTSSPATVTLTASAGSTTKTATLTVKGPGLSTVTLNPTSAYGGTAATGTVTLSAVAGVDTPVTLSVDQACASVPVTVTVPAGTTSATFTLSTVPVTASTQVIVTGVAGGATKTAKFTVKSPTLSSLAVSPATITGGTGTTGTVKLSSPAAVDTSITLSISGTAASVPATVTVPAGTSSATFSVTSVPVATTTTQTLTATGPGATKTVTVTVKH